MTDLDVLRFATFIAVTVALAVISRKALLKPRSHGFYRFFAWEAILALVMLNAPFWFSDPWSPVQVLSWVVLLSSAIVLWLGVSQLRRVVPTSARADEELYAFEKTSRLVTSGIYGLIRHPLYASLLYLTWGALFKNIAWQSAALAIVASLCLAATAKADERECIEYFGPEYERYMKGTKRFIPFLL